MRTLEASILASKGPKLKGTKTRSVRLFDDKSLYTGIYGRGGAKIRDEPRVINLDGDLVTRHDFAEAKAKLKSSGGK